MKLGKEQHPVNKGRNWSDDETMIIAKWASKLTVEEVTKLINEVSKTVRSVKAVQTRGNNSGFEFRVVAA